MTPQTPAPGMTTPLPGAGTNPNWRTRAVCALPLFRKHAELWFPHDADNDARRAAVRVCATCPVRQQCLNEAMAREGGRGLDSRHGIYGGLTPRQRMAAYRRTWNTRTGGTP